MVSSPYWATVRAPRPYALATAGASLHWMDAEIMLPRIARALAPNAMLAIVDQKYHDVAWNEALVEVIVRYSRSRDYDPHFALPEELERRRLFQIHGRYDTAPYEFVQPTRHYIEQFHSTASLARELMSDAEAERFDREVADVVRDFQTADGDLHLRTTASVVWGRPVARRP